MSTTAGIGFVLNTGLLLVGACRLSSLWRPRKGCRHAARKRSASRQHGTQSPPAEAALRRLRVPNLFGPTHDIRQRNGAELSRVGRPAAVIAEHERLAVGYREDGRRRRLCFGCCIQQDGIHVFMVVLLCDEAIFRTHPAAVVATGSCDRSAIEPHDRPR